MKTKAERKQSIETLLISALKKLKAGVKSQGQYFKK